MRYEEHTLTRNVIETSPVEDAGEKLQSNDSIDNDYKQHKEGNM